MRGVWHELRDGPAILRGVDADARARREGRADGPQRRRQVDAAAPRRRAARADARAHRARRQGGAAAAEPGRLLHPRARRARSLAASVEALAAAGLGGWPSATRATSPAASASAWRSRSSPTGEPPAVLALDEPTRGMDRQAKAELAAELRRRAGEGQAVIVATHDPEFAAACADRAVLLADGRVIADGSGGGAARGRLVLRHRDGPHPRRRGRRAAARAGRRAAAAARPRGGRAVSWPLASFLLVGVVLALGWLAYERARPSARMVAVVGPRWRPSPRSAATRSWRCPTSSRSRR